jgi:nucleotide-binding universal stress UspA family protein
MPAALAVFDRILCGVDGTPESLEAVRQAERLRSADGTLGLGAVMEVNTAVPGILLGGVAARLLHEAPCSVLLARPPQFGEFPSSIIVGVDGSPQSLAAAAVARAIAERFGSEYLIVAATGGQRIDLPPIQALSSYFVTDPGRPADVLAELSKEADLLVVGSRGLHGPRALGSVSERVGHRAASSVLVVRAQEAL